ncbi:MAG TPA: nitrile hydratase subunit alpha [Hyphomicrobiaceae bacterium]|nr:nitrile hydratase subunit alpha [Hyphomicrobiaceae bacterium]
MRSPPGEADGGAAQVDRRQADRRRAREPAQGARAAARRARRVGTEIGNDVEVRVHDSTAEMRYLVIPRRPEGGMSFPGPNSLGSSPATPRPGPPKPSFPCRTRVLGWTYAPPARVRSAT